jgi:hypothetical protein
MRDDGVQFGLLASQSHHFSMIRNDQWLIPGTSGPHELRIERNLAVTVDGVRVGSMPKFGLSDFSSASPTLAIDGHQVLVSAVTKAEPGALGSRTHICCDVFVDGRSLLDGAGVATLPAREASAENGPVAQQRRRFFSGGGAFAVISAGELVAIARGHSAACGAAILIFGNLLSLWLTSRLWRASSSMAPSTQRIARIAAVLGCFLGLAVTLVAGVLVAETA